MRVVVTGATGSVGTSLLRTFSLHGDIEQVTGIARRPAVVQIPKVDWVRADSSPTISSRSSRVPTSSFTWRGLSSRG